MQDPSKYFTQAQELGKKSSLIRSGCVLLFINFWNFALCPFFRVFIRWYLKLRFVKNTFWTKISKAVIVNHTQHFWHFFLVLRTVAFCCYNCLHLRREKFFPGVNSQHLVPTSFIIELIYCRSRRIIAP